MSTLRSIVFEVEVKFACLLKVDFDKTKHLSDPAIRRRKNEREKLMAQEREKEEKERKEQELQEQKREEERYVASFDLFYLILLDHSF